MKIVVTGTRGIPGIMGGVETHCEELDEKMSFNRTFTAFEDYESTRLLSEVEGELIPQIVDKLVTDIFQASASNW